MPFVSRLILIAASLLLPCCAWAEVRLIDSRIDVQQITEVRVDVPEGCVITGLGFRAHADNFTTMLCRYHRVSPDGRLVDPKEQRAGSEPDHACEVLVLLPEGYVVVGYGARGAPEWDITTLRVWARKLNTDGTLGNIEVFQDGSAPDSGLEREMHLQESDRALTGAGLRFHFNDVIGIYASSSRIANLSEDVLSRRLPLRGWIVDPAMRSNGDLTIDARRHLVRNIYSGESGLPAGTLVVDAAGRRTGRNLLPNVRATELAGAMASAAMDGSTGYAVWVTAGDTIVPGTINSLNLDALRILSNNPFIGPERLWSRITQPKYGSAAVDAASALRWAASANDLIFKIFGLAFQSENGRLLSYTDARARLQSMTEDPRRGQWAKMLLSPTNNVLELVQTEKDTAFWAGRIASASADAAVKANPGPATRELVEAVGDLESAATLWQAAAEAFVFASLYEMDAAPQTRGFAESAATKLQELAEQQDAFTGADEFAGSVRVALENAEKNSPLAVALNEVAELTSAGKANEAAQALSDILTDPVFGPHLSKRNESIAELATGLEAIWKPSNLRVLRGGDGTWQLAREAGEWAFVNQKNSVCIYLDAIGEPLEEPADFVLSFEYFDTGTSDITLQYDSEFETDKQYHPGGIVPRTDTGTWKTAVLELRNTRLSGGQNMLADMRLLGGYPLMLRNMSLSRK